MLYKISDNIISALGFSSKENYDAVKSGKTGLKLYENAFDLGENFYPGDETPGCVSIILKKMKKTIDKRRGLWYDIWAPWGGKREKQAKRTLKIKQRFSSIRNS